MKLLKFLFWLPVLLVVIVFVSNNNSEMSFNLWPFMLEIKVSGALAIVFLMLFGYVVAKVDSWFSYSPVRRALSSERKQNKLLDKKQKQLTDTISGLQDNITSLKSMNNKPIEEKSSFLSRFFAKFKRK